MPFLMSDSILNILFYIIMKIHTLTNKLNLHLFYSFNVTEYSDCACNYHGTATSSIVIGRS